MFNKKIILLICMFNIGCDQNIDESVIIVEENRISSELSERAFAIGNPERGRKLYFQCRACHSLKRNEPHKVGPNLFDIFDKRAAIENGFNYSSALKNSELIWNLETLDLWLEKPYELVPENKMIFSGIKDKNDRDDLLAYLYLQTSE